MGFETGTSEDDWVVVSGNAVGLETGDVQKELKVEFFSPAEYWTDALPVGNGRLGAMVESSPIYCSSMLIIEAIGEIMQRTRCSKYAITKTISQKYKEILPSDFKKNLFKELKDLVGKGVLLRMNNSFKLATRMNNSFKLATKSHANSGLNSGKTVFSTRVRSPKVSKQYSQANSGLNSVKTLFSSRVRSPKVRKQYSHANSEPNSVKTVFSTRVKSPNMSTAVEIDEDAEVPGEPSGSGSTAVEIDEDAEVPGEPSGSGSKVFIFNGTVQITAVHFK